MQIITRNAKTKKKHTKTTEKINLERLWNKPNNNKPKNFVDILRTLTRTLIAVGK